MIFMVNKALLTVIFRTYCVFHVHQFLDWDIFFAATVFEIEYCDFGDVGKTH
jgi:hypothetical protein